MVQIINDPTRGSFGSRVGTALGNQLSESIPKYVERHQLREGLSNFEKEAGTLTPMQQLARLSSIPGITPQMIASFGELGRYQAQGNALNNFKPGETKPGSNEQPFPKPKTGTGAEGQAASITTRPPLEETLNPYIPMTQDQIYQRASELFQTNPGLYGGNPEKALAAAELEDNRAQTRSNAIQGVRTKQQAVQDKVTSSLAEQAQNLGVDLPGDVFSAVEDKAINAVKPVGEGGEGLTEQEAKKKYGKELLDISKQYQEIKDIGKGRLLTRSAAGNKKALRSLRDQFKTRDDLQNFRDNLIAENGLSPSKASYVTYPVTDNKELSGVISGLKNRNPKLNTKTMTYDRLSNEDSVIFSTGAAAKVAQKLGKNDSLLSIAEEMKSRGYDPEVVMDYFDKNKKKLNLSALQLDELGKPRDFTPSFDDLWMFYFSGLDPIVEQK